MAELIDRIHYTNLDGLDPAEVCARTGAHYDMEQKCYSLPVFTSVCQIFPQKGMAEWQSDHPRLNDYLKLFAIHYLLSAPRFSLKSSWVSEKDMIGGATFFRGPHAIPTEAIVRRLNNSTAAFHQLCRDCSGTPLDMADASCQFSITERVPVALLYWLGDEDFEAEAKLLFDASLANHFALDIIFALAVGLTLSLADY